MALIKREQGGREKTIKRDTLAAIRLLLLLIAASQLACNLPALAGLGQDRVPEFINHPRPQMTVDYTPFKDAGCPKDESGLQYCDPQGPMSALGCDRISAPSDLLGGLQPSYPLWPSASSNPC